MVYFIGTPGNNQLYLLTKNIIDPDANIPYVWRYSWFMMGQKCRKMRPVMIVVAVNTIRQPVVNTWHDINHAASHIIAIHI